MGVPMERIPSPKQGLLERAARLVGPDQLAAQLGIPKSQLQAWIRGDVTMPDGKLLQLSTILGKVAGTKK
jgi:DNA-binding transcriptional regulator YiaG